MTTKITCVVGGTGGHIYPAISLAEKLKERNNNISIDFIGDKRPIVKKIIEGESYNAYNVTAAPFPRKKIWNIISFILKTELGFIESLIYLIKNKPDVLVSFGAYISVPVVFAAKLLRIPIVIHEQNYYPGLANKFLKFAAEKIAVSYEESIPYFSEKKVVLTGNPVRSRLFQISRDQGLKYFKLEAGRVNILIFGGSQGAQSINLSILGVLPYIEDMNDKINFIHICGTKNLDEVEASYSEFGFNAIVREYIEHMEYAYSLADLIVARAGATTIAEISALGIPSILIPYPGASENHQNFNTTYICEAGAAICYDEEGLGGEGLALRLAPLISDAEKRREMSMNSNQFREVFTNASTRLAEVVEEVTEGKKRSRCLKE
ncbi:undecaprenyldiphospho-muramoylpentapeptide beta-N-acetylglucosaminyltransferase [Elusimicrobiota bacterium]